MLVVLTDVLVVLGGSLVEVVDGSTVVLVDVDVLKLGHHGSADATDAAWLAVTSPEAAIVSANGTTHPHASVLTLVNGRGVPLYCTPQHGAVRIRVDADGAYTITTEAPAERPCAPGRSR